MLGFNRAGAAVILLAALVCSAYPRAVWGQGCRMDPDASHGTCGLPRELSNFQGYFECDNRVRIGKPETINELKNIVRSFKKVKAVGVGHSWWKEQFCSGSDGESVNIVMTELSNVRKLFSRSNIWSLANDPDLPIKVDETRRTVTVAAGVSQRQLLDYLAQFRYGANPNGWTLPAFSWFIDQTIAGAIATGTHGSSLRYGSLSNAVLGLRVVLADGSEKYITRESDPHLFRACLVSVGRLGVITEATLRIMEQALIERSSTEMSFKSFVGQMKLIQDTYNSVKRTGDKAAMYRALRPIDETQAFWYVPAKEVWRVDFDRLTEDDLEVYEPLVAGFDGPSQIPGVFNQQEKGHARRNFVLTNGPRFWTNSFQAALRPNVRSGTFESRKAYLSMTETQTREHSSFTAYDQYEVSVPMELFADCLEVVGKEVNDKRLWDGFRTPVLIRFVSEEDAYLSNTHGGPRVYFNMEDYVSYNSRRVNEKFQRVMNIFRTKCQARMHWGKAGWPKHAACFDGATEYPETWCDFGCAVQQVDPFGKFSGESDVWEWNAVNIFGQPKQFASCCTESGFDKRRCRCAKRQMCSSRTG